MRYLILLLLVGCANPKFLPGQCIKNRISDEVRQIERLFNQVYYYRICGEDKVYFARYWAIDRANEVVNCGECHGKI